MRNTLFAAATAALLSTAGTAGADPCLTPPRDWSQKTLDAYGERGAIWKLADASAAS